MRWKGGFLLNTTTWKHKLRQFEVDPFVQIYSSGLMAEVLSYSNLATLKAVSRVSRTWHHVSRSIAGEIAKSATLRTFPLARHQLPYLSPEVNWKAMYQNYKDAMMFFPPPEPKAAPSLNDYIFVCQFSICKVLSSDVVHKFTYPLELQAESTLAFATQGHISDPDRIFAHNQPSDFSPQLHLMCIQKSTGKKALISKAAEIDNVDYIHSIVHFEQNSPPLTSLGLQAFFHSPEGDEVSEELIVAPTLSKLQPSSFKDTNRSGSYQFKFDFRFYDDATCISRDVPVEALIAMLQNNIRFT